MRVVFIANGKVGPLEGGGPRRTHQLFTELGACFGRDKVEIITYEELSGGASSHNSRIANYRARVEYRLRNVLANPYQMLSSDRYGVLLLPRSVLHRYQERMALGGEVGVCVLEDARLAQLLAINDNLGIKTVVAPWSFEAFTQNLSNVTLALHEVSTGNDSFWHRNMIRSVLVGFANELSFYSRATRGWFLSKCEAAFASAMGLSAGYLPYYPVGESEEVLVAVRNHRSASTIDRGLFVITGGTNGQNRIALDQFLSRLMPGDIPLGSRIAIVGVSGLPSSLARHLDGKVQFLGRISTAAFDALLLEARAVLIPQNCGFGCMTRVPDMLCAGIPIVGDEIVANAFGEIPGMDFVRRDLGGWAAALDRAMDAPLVIASETYEKWIGTMRAVVSKELGLLR